MKSPPSSYLKKSHKGSDELIYEVITWKNFTFYPVQFRRSFSSKTLSVLLFLVLLTVATLEGGKD